jgi:ATP/maltotriose-dependent transcriptional regulator MalT
MGSLRVEEVCRSLADVAESRGLKDPADVLAVAAWRLASGGGGDPGLYLAAARQVHALIEPALVERLARASGAPAAASFEAGLMLAEAVSWQGRVEEADEILAELVTLTGRDDQQAELARARACGLFWGRGLAREAEAVLAEAESRISDVDQRQHLMSLRATVCLLSGRAVDACSVVVPVLESAASESHLVYAAMVAIPALALCGQLDQALIEARRALSALEAGPELVAETRASLILAVTMAYERTGNLAEASTLARALYDEAMPRQVTLVSSIAAMMVGITALAAGDAGEATRWLNEAITQLRERDVGGVLPLALAGQAQALAYSGRSAEAALVMAEADAAATPMAATFAPDAARARAWVAASAGELSQARSLAVDAADLAEAAGQRAVEVVGLHDALRLGAPMEVVGRLVEVGTVVEGRLAASYVAHGRALAANDGRSLDEVSEAFEDMGVTLLAAAAAAEAAVAYGRAGLMVRRSGSLARASVLAARCGRPQTPALANVDHADVLSRREREVAGLAADGLSNREIAQRLVISVRTVEGHLAQAFATLGVTRRQDVGPLLGQPDRWQRSAVGSNT